MKPSEGIKEIQIEIDKRLKKENGYSTCLGTAIIQFLDEQYEAERKKEMIQQAIHEANEIQAIKMEEGKVEKL